MRFNKFLIESDKFTNFLKEVKSHCSEFVSKTTGPLYRGTSNETIGYNDAIEDRKPKDSKKDKIFNNGLNLGIEYLFKEPNIRTRALFCTNAQHQARSYGKLNFIFPSDGCKFIWSDNIYDSYEDLHFDNSDDFRRALFSLTQLMNLVVSVPNVDEKFLKDFIQKNPDKTDKKSEQTILKMFGGLLDDEGYKMSDHPGAPVLKKAGHEILVFNAKRYYKINVSYAAKELGIKDDNSAMFETKVYTKLVEAINAKVD